MWFFLPWLVFQGWFRGRAKCNPDGTYLLGTQVNRIFCWAIPFAIASIICFGLPLDNWWSVLDFVVLVACYWLGLAIYRWSPWYNMGRNGSPAFWNCFANLIWRGLLVTIFAGGWLYFRTQGAHAIIVAAAGVLMPIAYTIGWVIPSKIKNLESGPPIAEPILALIIAAALLMGAL